MDDDDMVRVMVAMLEALGHSVVESRHGRSASMPSSREPVAFDLVILDLTIVGGHDGLTIGHLREITCPRLGPRVTTMLPWSPIRGSTGSSDPSRSPPASTDSATASKKR